ncbi:membrane-bound O-acyltransferase gup1 isoform X1 [Nymphaea colorata]|nr:membrane-bound O-acyltransferase gup1 isoform X1 [Nymphaea colorata]XP_031473931.1 membrane-bound O-acyltransferase gup1 isoform X1 [Nymphaea colorata]XP_031473932.1 membrane-bound O-acyltransferase gup1 isoform X1 [Nymphaea colorata]XP_031473933.1 membrane-bound O-acyltransferase gup1 isoform X1 [Nymphaea colorata]XP_049931601.1 membrane-bound O-acyltransferase gup1 isoform X1 [Nymphaea colorata]
MAIDGWVSWKFVEPTGLVLYAVAFYIVIIQRSLRLSHDYTDYSSSRRLVGLREGWMGHRLNDLSDSQWRNFRENLAILTIVFGVFTLLAYLLRKKLHLKWRGMSIVWLLLSLSYISYLHGACVIFILAIATLNFLLVKIFLKSVYFSFVIWSFNILVLLCNRVYEGYSFSWFGEGLAFLDGYRGTFRWQICFNLVILRMISFAYDHYWAHTSCVDQKEKSVYGERFSFETYLCYLIYAPLYIAGPIISFNSFSSQLDVPNKNYSAGRVAWYCIRWILSLFLMELMTHFFYYNAFAISGLWTYLSPLEVFIVGYGVLNFMWLKFFLIWRYFRFWALVGGIEAPENMPRCINNCYSLETFWKSWHASFNKWLVRYMYIPLGGSKRKLLNVWVIFTFVAIWHDLEWKLISWAWLTCLFFVPEIIAKSVLNSFQPRDAFGQFILREISAICGAVTISCLMIANLVGYVIGPSGVDWLISRMLRKDGLPTVFGIFLSFYVGTKLMFYIRDARSNHP